MNRTRFRYVCCALIAVIGIGISAAAAADSGVVILPPIVFDSREATSRVPAPPAPVSTPATTPAPPTPQTLFPTPASSAEPAPATLPYWLLRQDLLPQSRTERAVNAPLLVWVNRFSDVGEADAVYDAVRYLTESGLMSGLTPTAFGVNEMMSRAMAAALLYRLADAPEREGNTAAADIDGGDWCADAVGWSLDSGILDTDADDCFRPYDEITREELITALYRYAQNGGYAGNAMRAAAADLSAVSDSAREPVRWALRHELLENEAEVLAAPAASVTRAEAALLIYMFCLKILP